MNAANVSAARAFSAAEVVMDHAFLERLHAEIEEEKERLHYLQGLFQAESMPDMLDNAAHMEAVRFAEALAERSAGRLRELRALAAKGPDIHCFCEDCGELIPESRLLAAPGCVRCRACQAFHEGEKGRDGQDED